MPKLPITVRLSDAQVHAALIREAMDQLGYPDGQYTAEAVVNYAIVDGKLLLDVELLKVYKS